MHELNAIGELALGNGGGVLPQPLKERPPSGRHYTNLALGSAAMVETLRACDQHLIGKVRVSTLGRTSPTNASLDPEVCSVTEPNSTFICGMAHAVMDIDWNGDVYPCHLSKGPDLLIGNIFREDFPAIFQRVDERGVRVRSHEIEQCSGCKFGS